MILLVLDKEMSVRDFNTVCECTKRDLYSIDLTYFRFWYINGIGYFKISNKDRRVLEKHLYVID